MLSRADQPLSKEEQSFLRRTISSFETKRYLEDPIFVNTARSLSGCDTPTLIRTLELECKKEEERLLKRKDRAIARFQELIEQHKSKSEEKEKQDENEALDTMAKYFLEYTPPKQLHSNPFAEEGMLFDGARGDISCDSASGYDGEKNMSCWDLRHNSQSTDSLMNMAEALKLGKWKLEEKTFLLLMKLGRIFQTIGFAVWCVEITTWRKGYDYQVYSVSGEVEYGDNSYYRFYVQH